MPLAGALEIEMNYVCWRYWQTSSRNSHSLTMTVCFHFFFASYANLISCVCAAVSACRSRSNNRWIMSEPEGINGNKRHSLIVFPNNRQVRLEFSLSLGECSRYTKIIAIEILAVNLNKRFAYESNLTSECGSAARMNCYMNWTTSNVITTA